MNNQLLNIDSLKVHFPIKSGVMQKTTGYIKAVDGVNLSINKGETLGLVGESGCGKTTIGRAIVRLNTPIEGTIKYDGVDLLSLDASNLREKRKNIQMIFQDPYSSLNPRHTVGSQISEILAVQMKLKKSDIQNRVSQLLNQVGLSPSYADRYPHEFSGGQRQRIAIAKALAFQPNFIVCDEAVSALDVSIQSQIINLLMDLKEELGITYLFISHALNVVEHISDRIAVMYLGKIMELSTTEELFANPLHPYTKALLSAIPILSGQEKKERIVLNGEIPSASKIPGGCRFHTRCPLASERCSKEEPMLTQSASGHFAACHFV